MFAGNMISKCTIISVRLSLIRDMCISLAMIIRALIGIRTRTRVRNRARTRRLACNMISGIIIGWIMLSRTLINMSP